MIPFWFAYGVGPAFILTILATPMVIVCRGGRRAE